MQAQTELCHSLQLPQGRITFTLLNASFKQNTEWSQKTAFDKEERDFKTNNPHSLTWIQVQTRGTVVKKHPTKTPDISASSSLYHRACGFYFGCYLPFWWCLLSHFSRRHFSISPHLLCSVGDPVSCRCVLCLPSPSNDQPHRSKWFSAPERYSVSKVELWKQVWNLTGIRKTGLLLHI